MNIHDPNFHGWNEDLSTDWISVPYPEDVSELLLANDEQMTVSARIKKALMMTLTMTTRYGL